MHKQVLNTYNHTGERPQGCQVRKHAWRQLLKLVVGKVQIAVATKHNVEIEQTEPEQIVSARVLCLSGFGGSCGIIICSHALLFTLPLNCTFV
jgi:hypothetical protein